MLYHLKHSAPWLAKDVVWVIPDASCGLVESMQAWTDAYQHPVGYGSVVVCMPSGCNHPVLLEVDVVLWYVVAVWDDHSNSKPQCRAIPIIERYQQCGFNSLSGLYQHQILWSWHQMGVAVTAASST